MSIQLKILATCMGLVAIIAVVGGLAEYQVVRVGRLAIGIYDHAFMGMSYVDQAEAEFLRWSAARRPDQAIGGQDSGLHKVLDRLDVAQERTASAKTQAGVQQARALVEALQTATPDTLLRRVAETEKALGKLVRSFSADGLEGRDDAEENVAASRRNMLIQVGVAIILALGAGVLLGRNLSRPLRRIVDVIGHLAAGDLTTEVAPRLTNRRDEIGAVARAAGVFREAMQQNAGLEAQRQQVRLQVAAEKYEVLQTAADEVEKATNTVAMQTVQSSAVLTKRAGELATAAARMVERVDAVTRANVTAVASCDNVAAAGEQLSASAREIGTQTARAAQEVAHTARAGDRARGVIEQLSASVTEIDSVVRLIGDVAGRTNLLALNATIEAARAGEAGKGFAVVAGEVKSLAAQTARSTSDIARSIASIQAVTSDVVAAVGEMLHGVSAIEGITRVVAASVEEQVAATERIASNVAETAGAMRAVADQMEMANTDARGADDAVKDLQARAGTVASQIGDLREVMSRIVRTASEAADRRAEPRISVALHGTLSCEGRDLAVDCNELSAGGARLRIRESLEPGVHVILRLPGLPDLPGIILESGEHARMRFDWDAQNAPLPLRQYVEQKLAA